MSVLAPYTRRVFRQHNLSDGWTRALVWGAAAASLALLIGVTDWSLAPQAKAARPKTKTPLAPGIESAATPEMMDAMEPDEGYADRWASRRALATKRCRQDPSVTSYPQMVRCALAYAYPEAGTWNETPDTGWMRAASMLAQADLRAVIEAAYPGAANGWKIQLWLHGPRLAQSCAVQGSPAKSAACMALTMYPDAQWPPTSASAPWQREFYHAVRGLVTEGVPKPGSIGV